MQRRLVSAYGNIALEQQVASVHAYFSRVSRDVEIDISL
jgi:hypothetical protein